MEKVRPEVAGLTERVFVIRQQYLVPWIPGPYLLTNNFQSPISRADTNHQHEAGEKNFQFWRVANATLQAFLPLQVQVNGVAVPLEMIALDGYPLTQTRTQTTILVPPAGRAEFIVQAPVSGTAVFVDKHLRHRSNRKRGYCVHPGDGPDHNQQRDCIVTQMPAPTQPSGDDTKFRAALRCNPRPRNASSISLKSSAAPTAPSSSTSPSTDRNRRSSNRNS